MSKFKVGDQVRKVKGNESFPLGEEFVIEALLNTSGAYQGGKSHGDYATGRGKAMAGVYVRNLELVEPKPAPELKFRVTLKRVDYTDVTLSPEDMAELITVIRKHYQYAEFEIEPAPNK